VKTLSLSHASRRSSARGFTLVELLVVIAIIAVLATLIFGAVRSATLKAQKVRCLGAIREINTALQTFNSDYMRPPIPPGIAPGTLADVTFGDTGGQYTNDYIVSVLEGEDKTFSFAGGDWNTRTVNPKLEEYIKFPRNTEKKNGVNNIQGDATFGQILDPWGSPFMIAINVPPFNTERSAGMNDKWMETFEKGVYAESQPRYEPFVIWSYGRDKLKGTGGAPNASNRLDKSDDVVSW
jgi:prepilin-type N-terminal cleavage/methylation domain-containing protein